MSRPFSAEFDLLPSKKYFVRLRSQDEDQGKDVQVFEGEIDEKAVRKLCAAAEVDAAEVDEMLGDAAEGVVADLEFPEGNATLTKLGLKDVSERFQAYRVEVVEGAAALQKKLVQDDMDGYDPLFITQSDASYTVTSIFMADELDDFDDLEDLDDLELLDEDEDEDEEDGSGALEQ
ncbi:MAG: hypothetical protein ABI383_02400 [Acidobacteriaceae bacterium]